ncbi:MAG: substrate-binding domain-containing protein [Vicinamibacterales bacterium]
MIRIIPRPAVYGLAIAWLAFAVTLWPAGARARGDDVLVMSNGATTPAWLALVPVIEQATGHRMVTVATAMGSGANAIPSRVRRGEPVDIVLLPSGTIDDLIRDGAALAGSREDFARSRIGLAVPAGAPSPRVSTVAELRAALLAAPSIAVSAQVSGQYVTAELFPRLGIAEQVVTKLRRVEGELVADMLARREAALGFQQISELVAAPGVDYVGPLPSELQRTTVMAAGIPKSALHTDAARDVIRVLASPRAAAILEASGLDPIVRP